MKSVEKGKRGEREIANILKKEGFDCRRGQQYSGANGDADVVGLEGVHIEVKRVENLNVLKAFEQSKRDSRQGETPTVFHRKNRSEWLVTMNLHDFLSLYKRWRT